MKTAILGSACASICWLLTTSANAALVDGLIAHWSFDGNASDVTGNGHDGTVVGAVLTTDRLGSDSSAYSFDGNDFISVPDSSSLTLGSNPFTLAAWAKIDAFTTDGAYYLMGHDVGPGPTNKWIFAQRNDGISFVTTATSWLDLGNFNFQIGDWHHLAIRRDGDLLTAFVDGSIIGSIAFVASIPDPAASLLIGDAEDEHPGRNYRGALDDVRIYNRALSNSEIAMLASVPIPAAAWLFGSGMLGLVGIARRKNAV